MDKSLQRRIAATGGRATHAKGTAHRFTSEDARVAGLKRRRALEELVTKLLMEACTRRGIRPAGPFESVSAFASYVMDVYPVIGSAQREQLRLLGEAIGEARLGRLGGVVDRLEAIAALAGHTPRK